MPQRLGHPVEFGQDPLGGGSVAEFEQVGQAQDTAVEFGLGLAAPWAAVTISSAAASASAGSWLPHRT